MEAVGWYLLFGLAIAGLVNEEVAKDRERPIGVWHLLLLVAITTCLWLPALAYSVAREVRRRRAGRRP